jgi:hypothetical protein
MTLVIVATASATDANAYCTLAEAEAYVATMTFASDWVGKTNDQKNAAIVQAARWLDTLQWKGSRSSQAQSMAWPRCGDYNASMPRFTGLTVQGTSYLMDQDGFQVPSDTVPACIKNANAEMALRQLGSDWTQGLGPVSNETLKVGSIDLGRESYQPFPSSVVAMIKPFLACSPNSGGRLVRG